MPQSSLTSFKGFKRSRVSKKKGLNRLEKKQVKNIIDSKMETKLVQVADVMDTSAEITLGTAFVWADIMPLGIAEGTGEEQRIGDEITLQSYHLRYFVNDDATQAVSFRMIAVYFPDSDGAGFEAHYNGNDMLAFHPRKEETDLRYKILYDRLHIAKYLSTTDGEFRSSFKDIKLKVKGLKVQYDSSAVTINRGAIKILLITQPGNNTMLAHTADLSALSVLRYKD